MLLTFLKLASLRQNCRLTEGHIDDDNRMEWHDVVLDSVGHEPARVEPRPLLEHVQLEAPLGSSWVRP